MIDKLFIKYNNAFEAYMLAKTKSPYGDEYVETQKEFNIAHYDLLKEMLVGQSAIEMLALITKEAETNQKWAFLEWQNKAEELAKENKRLQDTLDEVSEYARKMYLILE